MQRERLDYTQDKVSLDGNLKQRHVEHGMQPNTQMQVFIGALLVKLDQ